MNYLDIVNLTFGAIGVFLGVISAYMVFFNIVGMFKNKKYPATEEKLKYAIVVAARNEARVIADLIQSVYKSNYDQKKLQIFVMAHNCTDKTAEIARKNGAIVYEYNNPNERTKGYALHEVFKCIIRDYGVESFDGYVVFDADNVLDPEFLNKMNDAFVACDKKACITTFRCAKNFGENAMAANYGIMYATHCRLEFGGRSNFNCSARLLGSGFVVPWQELKDGWTITNLSDDTDFTVEQLLKGKRVQYCNDAYYYDEQPTDFKTMYNQRLRWAKGTQFVYRKRFKSLMKSVFGRENEGTPVRGSLYDILYYMSPFGISGVILLFLNLLSISLCPLFGISAAYAWTIWGISTGIWTGIGYLVMALFAIAVYVIERKRIGKIPFSVKLKSILTHPFFLLFALLLQVIALFTKKVGWKPVAHNNTSDSETFNTQSAQNQICENKGDCNMKVVVLSGGSGNDAMLKGLEKLVSGLDLKVIVNAYDNGKSTGVCRAVTNTLGVSDIRKNHSRMYQVVYGDKVDADMMEFYDGRFDLPKGREAETVIELLKKWGMDEYIPYATAFFKREKAHEYEYKSFSISNIIYSEMYAQKGYEYTNKHFCDKLKIDDFVVLNSFDNVFIKAQTESGHIIDDEGITVFWNNPDDKIVKTIYDVKSSVGLNPKAIKLIQEADLIIVSTGTFYSSLQPTIEYLDFYKYINASSAKKIWVMNNEYDGDSLGVSDLDLVKAMEKTGLDLGSFVILLNADANPVMEQTDSAHNFVIMPMGNIKGKHDPDLYAKALLKIYYGLHKQYDKILFDFDDTVYSRDAADEGVSVENVKLLAQLAARAIVISGNSYRSIREKLTKIYGETLDGWNVDIWADANSILYRNNVQVQVIEEHIIDCDVTEKLADIIKEHNLHVEVIGNPPVCYKIKPLSQEQREELTRTINAKYSELFKAEMTGRTTVDIVAVRNSKESVFEVGGYQSQKTLYIGDEIIKGNDNQIARRCNAVIRVKGVTETNLILKLLAGDET